MHNSSINRYRKSEFNGMLINGHIDNDNFRLPRANEYLALTINNNNNSKGYTINNQHYSCSFCYNYIGGSFEESEKCISGKEDYGINGNNLTDETKNKIYNSKEILELINNLTSDFAKDDKETTYLIQYDKHSWYFEDNFYFIYARI